MESINYSEHLYGGMNDDTSLFVHKRETHFKENTYEKITPPDQNDMEE